MACPIRVIACVLSALIITLALMPDASVSAGHDADSNIEVDWWFVPAQPIQGDDVSIILNITFFSTEGATIDDAGINLGWQPIDHLDRPEAYSQIALANGESAEITIPFNVPDDADPGNHNYFILVNYTTMTTASSQLTGTNTHYNIYAFNITDNYDLEIAEFGASNESADSGIDDETKLFLYLAIGIIGVSVVSIIALKIKGPGKKNNDEGE